MQGAAQWSVCDEQRERERENREGRFHAEKNIFDRMRMKELCNC